MIRERRDSMRRVRFRPLLGVVVAVAAVAACGADAKPQAAANVTLNSSEGSAVPHTQSATPLTASTSAGPLEGEWRLTAARDGCGFDQGSLDGQTLTVTGDQVTITNPFGPFEGKTDASTSTSVHIAASQKIEGGTSLTLPDGTPLPPPALTLDIVVIGPDEITGRDLFSNINPSGQTGVACDRTFKGRRTSGADALLDGPPYDTGGAAGSGCTPGDVESLPDGWWAGFVTTAHGSTIDFDLVCFFLDDAANAAAAQDGKPTPVDDDVYIRNQNSTTFRETFPSGDVPAACVNLGDEHFSCTVADVLRAQQNPDGIDVGSEHVPPFPLTWLHVSAGQPDFLYMQFHP
jgi:hypothetical protein